MIGINTKKCVDEYPKNTRIGGFTFCVLYEKICAG